MWTKLNRPYTPRPTRRRPRIGGRTVAVAAAPAPRNAADGPASTCVARSSAHTQPWPLTSGQRADRQQHTGQVAYHQGHQGASRAQAPLRETTHRHQTQQDHHVLGRLQRHREPVSNSPRPALLEGRKAIAEDLDRGLEPNGSHSAPVATPIARTSTVRLTVTGTRRANPNARRTQPAAPAPVPLSRGSR